MENGMDVKWKNKLADENEGNSTDRRASKSSVYMALDIARSAASKFGMRKRNEILDSSEKIASFCLTSLVDEDEYPKAASGFSENYAITEMRSCLARCDWASLRELFPLLLDCYSEVEPILWRYALTLLLCSPDRDSSYLQEFLEMCIATRTIEDRHLLERLLTLQDQDSGIIIDTSEVSV